MGDDDKVDMRRRIKVKNDLAREAQRLAQHIKHISVDDIRHLERYVTELAAYHASEEECVNLCRKHRDHHPPWGTRHASVWERTWRTVFPNAWPW